MQFAPDIEMCLRDPMKIRTLVEPRKQEVINTLHQLRLVWHQMRACLHPKSAEFLKRRG